MASSRSAGPLLYHEKQVAALCGVHCINTLLQGPMFSEIDLAQIAQELDELEKKAFMQEGGGLSEEYKAWAADGSGNVAADGMFSIQVLEKALAVWNLVVIPLNHPDVHHVKAEPQAESAFICNLQEHWFTVLKVGDEWWNMNSLFPAPQPLGTFYLSAFLASLAEQGYTVYVVRGPLPKPSPPNGSVGHSDGPGHWFTPEEAKAANVEAESARHRGKVANVLENALSRAAAGGGTIQLRPKRQRNPSTDGAGPSAEDYEDADLAAAIAASLADTSGGAGSSGLGAGFGAGPSRAAGVGQARGARGGGGGETAGSYGGGYGEGDDADADLAAAIAASLSADPSLPAPGNLGVQPGFGAVPTSAAGGGAGPSGLGQGLGLAGVSGGLGGRALGGGPARSASPAAATLRRADSAQASDGNHSTAATAGTTTTSSQRDRSWPPAGGYEATGGYGSGVGGGDDEDAELAAAIAASLSDQAQSRPEAGGSSAFGAPEEAVDIGAEPEAGEGVVELAFRLPSSQRVSRRFTVASTPASHLYGFVAAAAAAAQGGGLPAGAFVICTAFPRKALPSSATLLTDLGLTSSQLLNVTPGTPPDA